MNHKDLTPQFRKFRADARLALPQAQESHEDDDDDATATLLNSALGGTSRDMEMGSITGAFAPSWVQKSESIRMDCSILKDKLQKLKGAHSKALMVTFDSSNDAEAHVEIITRDIQSMFRKLDNEIKGMCVKGQNQDSDVEVQQNVQKQLAQALFKLSIEFRKEQTGYLNKVEAQKGMVSGSAGYLDDEQSEISTYDPGFTQQQKALVDDSQASILERDTQIGKIVETITDLTSIMRDLSTLIVEQGSMLDRIDRRVEQVAGDVKSGLKQLEGAEKVQKSTCAWTCTLVLVALVVLMVIIIVLRHAFMLF